MKMETFAGDEKTLYSSECCSHIVTYEVSTCSFQIKDLGLKYALFQPQGLEVLLPFEVSIGAMVTEATRRSEHDGQSPNFRGKLSIFNMTSR